jgi:hypothetical protein
MTTCAQKCLALEPLLAVVLSTVPLSGSKNKYATFDKFASKVLVAGQSHQTANQANGELNELIMTAAVQASSRQNGFLESRVTVDEFVNEVYQYLRPALYDKRRMDAIRDVLQGIGKNVTSEPFEAADELKYSFGPGAEDLMKKVKMPWFVIACSHKKLSSKVKECELLLKDCDIAGLVPGKSGDLLDCCAYNWASGTPLCWKFEFRVRSGGYSVGDAITDLKRKCGDPEKQKAKTCHTLLICFRGEGGSECKVDSYKGKLRIILLIGDRKASRHKASRAEKLGKGVHKK